MHIEARHVGGDVAERDESGQHPEIDVPRGNQPAQRLGPFGADGAAAFRDERNRLLAARGVKGTDIQLGERNLPLHGDFPRTPGLRGVGHNQRRNETTAGRSGMVTQQRLGIGSGTAHEKGGPRRTLRGSGK